jgi:hypothetical protein
MLVAFLKSGKLPPVAFHLGQSLSLKGQLNIHALENALNEIVCRHEVLRTAFPEVTAISLQTLKAVWCIFSSANALERGIFQQHIRSRSELHLSVRSTTPSGQNTLGRRDLAEIATEELKRPIKYNQPPLLRATLVKIGDEEHILIVVIPHLISDGWSLTVLRKEIEVLYEYFSNFKDYPLPPPSKQYADFVTWERTHLQGAELERRSSYWKGLWPSLRSGLLKRSDIPFAQREPSSAHAWGRCDVDLEPCLTEQVRAFVRRHRFTLYTLALATVNILFHLYSGKAYITMRTVWANRTQRETENLIGWFSNSRLLSVGVDPDSPAFELLPAIRKSVFDANANNVPLELLEMIMQKAGTSLYEPDNIIISFDLVSDANIEPVRLADGLIVEPVEIRDTASPYGGALDLYMHSKSCGLAIIGHYDRALFSQADVRTILVDIRKVLARFVAAPSDPIRAFGISV